MAKNGHLNDQLSDIRAVGLDAGIAGTTDVSVLRWAAATPVAAGPYLAHTETAAGGSLFTSDRRGRFFMRLGIDGTGAGAQGFTLGVSVGATGASLTGEPVAYTLGMLGITSATVSLATTDYALHISDIAVVQDAGIRGSATVTPMRFHCTQADGTTLVGADLVEATVNAHIIFVSDSRA